MILRHSLLDKEVHDLAKLEARDMPEIINYSSNDSDINTSIMFPLMIQQHNNVNCNAVC